MIVLAQSVHNQHHLDLYTHMKKWYEPITMTFLYYIFLENINNICTQSKSLSTI